jgi:hypothetical protein
MPIPLRADFVMSSDKEEDKNAEEGSKPEEIVAKLRQMSWHRKASRWPRRSEPSASLRSPTTAGVRSIVG